MLSELKFTQAELDDRLNAFVWSRDMTPSASFLIYSPEARELYQDAEEGIRVKHIIFASKLVELKIAHIESRPNVEDDIQYVKEDLTDLKNYLTRKLGHVPLSELVKLTLVHSFEIESENTISAIEQVA